MKRFALCLVLVSTVALGACRKGAEEQKAEAAPAAAPAAAATPAPQPPPPPKPMPAVIPEVVARVNGQDVTKTDFDRLIRNIELQNGGRPVPPERRDEILRAALDQLVTYTVLSQEVKARNISVPEGEIEKNLAQMKQQAGSDQAFKKALAERNMTEARLRADARTDLAINKIIEEEVAKAGEATDAEVKEFYEKNPDKFKQDEAVRASHILIRVDPKADEATRQKARAKAEDLARQAKAGADFAQLARDHSADGSAAQGGDLDFMVQGQTVKPFNDAIFSMQPNQISDVVETEFGYHVIKVTEKRAASQVPLERVSARVRQHLTEQKQRERYEAFIQELKAKARIEVLV